MTSAIDVGLTVRVTIAALLVAFPVVLTVSYYCFRLRIGDQEDHRRLRILGMLEQYPEIAEYGKGFAALLALAVTFLSFVVATGAAVLLFLDDFGTADRFPREGSRTVLGMAFAGAYLWGLHYLLRRYSMNDLIPGVYYTIGARILLASAVALVIANAAAVLSDQDSGGFLDETMWPTLAFLIGTFPQRGLKWLGERVPFLGGSSDPGARALPLELIEGVSAYDRMRLEEFGIDDCHDLADEDFVPLFIHTPYAARKLISWILQAKLCVFAGPGVRSLRERGILRVTDLLHLSPEAIDDLAAHTPVTVEGLRGAQRSLREDVEIGRLQKAAILLGRFTEMKLQPQGAEARTGGDSSPDPAAAVPSDSEDGARVP